MGDPIVIQCPNCQAFIEVLREQVNCAIFRHGIYKKDLKQMDPHAPKEVCDELVRQELIYGCGRPFKLCQVEGTWYAVKCDYI